MHVVLPLGSLLNRRHMEVGGLVCCAGLVMSSTHLLANGGDLSMNQHRDTRSSAWMHVAVGPPVKQVHMEVRLRQTHTDVTSLFWGHERHVGRSTALPQAWLTELLQ